MIQNINVNKLVNHPDNPRKDLGDLSELIDSIKTQGILQNLTVVPGEGDTYVVVIGNRRLAAAKQAGLEELPCKIADMEYKDQISTMLLENMQRQDLTLYEQAQGFQMMIDLGVPVAKICEKTGLSYTTVRRRVKMAELDQEILKDRVANNVTIEELVMLEKIEDEVLKNRLLQLTATHNFKWEYDRALFNQEKEKKAKAMLKLIGDIFAKELKNVDYSQYFEVGRLDLDAKKAAVTELKEELTKTIEDGKTLFYHIGYNELIIYRQKNEEEDGAFDEEKQKLKEVKNKLQCVLDEVKKQWKTFAAEISNTALKDNKENIIKSLCMKVGEYRYGSYGDEISEFLTKTKRAEENEDVFGNEYIEKNYFRILFLDLFFWDFPHHSSIWDWEGCFSMDEQIEKFWLFLKSMGYVPSDEETGLMTGKHELYHTENDEYEEEEQDD